MCVTQEVDNDLKHKVVCSLFHGTKRDEVGLYNVRET
jgi:hypothetical protein